MTTSATLHLLIPEPMPQNTHIRFNNEASPSPPVVFTDDESESEADSYSDDEYTYTALTSCNVIYRARHGVHRIPRRGYSNA